MDQALFTLPILPGQTEAARAFLEDLNGPRQAQFAASNQRAGIVQETWAVQSTAQGDVLVHYCTGEDIGAAFAQVAASQEPFERWLKQQLQLTTGADLNTPPSGPLSDILANYRA